MVVSNPHYSNSSSPGYSPEASPAVKKCNTAPQWLSWNYNFDIDHYLNPFLISGPRLIRRLPSPVSRFLGHRNELRTEKESDLIIWSLAFLGAFSGVLVLEAVFMHWPEVISLGSPIIVGSYGAAAILLYNAIDSPLSQPRNAFFGQILSAFIGIATTKLFALSPKFETDYVWLAGALSCALASVLMGLTRTVHPPAGATALLAAVDDRVRHMGWFLIPVVVVSSGLMIMVALVMGNVQRTYPRYWWTPGMVGKDLREARNRLDLEKGVEKVTNGGREDESMVIKRDTIEIPGWLVLGDVERDVLEVIRGRMQEYYGDMEAGVLGRVRALDVSETTLVRGNLGVIVPLG